MIDLQLPSIRVGLLNVEWNNGSRVKPANPLTYETILEFEHRPDLKINWVNEFTGLVTIDGDFNYLIFNDHECYFLEKTRVIDLDKLIFVYTVIKDHWQSFISNPNNSVKGCLIKTNDEKLIWENVQKTSAAISDVNNEITLHACTDEKCQADSFSQDLEFIPYKSGQMGFNYRFTAEGLKTFIAKINNIDPKTTYKTNDIIAKTQLIKEDKWEDYIGGLVNEFFNTHKELIILATPEANSVKSVCPAVDAKLTGEGWQSQRYIITKEAAKGSRPLTILTSTKTTSHHVKKIDLSQVTQIKLLDIHTLKEKHIGNKSIFDLSTVKTEERTSERETLSLKNKLYSPVAKYETFKHLNISKTIYKASYQLNKEQITAQNLGANENAYVKHGFNFSNSNVPAIYYQDWSETVKDPKLLKVIRDNWLNTELGFLLYKISNYGKTLLNISNKHVYNGLSIQMTTGFQVKDIPLNCSVVQNMETNTIMHGTKSEVLFSEVYRDEIAQSFWLAIWGVYLWEGQNDRIFAGLSPRYLETTFKYTVPRCWADNKGNIWTSLSQSNSIDDKKDKLPNFAIQTFNPKTDATEFLKVLQQIAIRRKNVEINETIYPPLVTGDIYWNELTQGLFNDKDEEFKFKTENNDPYLILFADSSYEFNRDGSKYKPIKEGSWGYRLGVLKAWKSSFVGGSVDNLIVSDVETPHLYYIRPIMLEQIIQVDVIEKSFIEALNKFFTLNSFDRQPPVGPYANETNITISKSDWVHQWAPSLNWGAWWPKNKRGKMAGIKSVGDWQTNQVGSSYTYLVLWLYEMDKPLYLWNRKTDTGRVADYVNKLLLRDIFINPGLKFQDYTSWKTSPDLVKALRPSEAELKDSKFHDFRELIGYKDTQWDAASKLSTMIKSTYAELNNEEISGLSYTQVNKEYLQSLGTDSAPCLFSFGNRGKILYYVLIKWYGHSPVPTIEIYIADTDLYSKKLEKKVTLLPSASAYCSDLVKVVNQQNFLYVYGTLLPIKTKMITKEDALPPIFKFTINDVNTDDNTSNFYRVTFIGGGGDYIKTTITVAKRKVGATIGETSSMEWTKIRMQMEEARHNRDFTRSDLTENERLLNLNVRNQRDDLNWEKDAMWWNGLANGVQGGLNSATAFAFSPNKITAGLNVASSAIGMVSGLANQSHQLSIKSRNIEQQDMQNAFTIQQQKNRLNTAHKFEELREKNRIYENSNVVVSALPNEVNLIKDIQEFETGGKDIAIISRMPDHDLYKYLVNYHKNYGFDIFLNDEEIYARSFNKSEGKIFQFGRVDSLSVSNLQEKDLLKNVFLNGVYLNQHSYKLTHLSFLELRKQHEAKKAAAAAQVLKLQKEKQEQEKETAKAVAKGIEEGKKEFKDLTAFKDKALKEAQEQLKKINSLENQIDLCNKTIKNYELDETSKKAALQSEINDLKSQIKGESSRCVYEIKKIAELEATLKGVEGIKATADELKADKIKLQANLHQEILKNNALSSKYRKDVDDLALNLARAQAQQKAEALSLSGLEVLKNDLLKSETELNAEVARLKAQIQILQRRAEQGVHSEEVEQLKARAAKLDEVNRELVKKKTRLIRLISVYRTVLKADYLWKNIMASPIKYAYIEYKGKYFYMYDKTKKHDDQPLVIKSGGFGFRLAPSDGAQEYFQTHLFVPTAVKNVSFVGLKLLEKKHTINPYEYSSSYKGFSLYFPNDSEMRFVTYVVTNPIWLDELKRALKPIIDTSNDINDLCDEIAQFIIENDDVISDAADFALEWSESTYVRGGWKETQVKDWENLIESTELKNFPLRRT